MQWILRITTGFAGCLDAASQLQANYFDEPVVVSATISVTGIILWCGQCSAISNGK
jgi:hypothetical protein